MNLWIKGSVNPWKDRDEFKNICNCQEKIFLSYFFNQRYTCTILYVNIEIFCSFYFNIKNLSKTLCYYKHMKEDFELRGKLTLWSRETTTIIIWYFGEDDRTILASRIATVIFYIVVRFASLKVTKHFYISCISLSWKLEHLEMETHEILIMYHLTNTDFSIIWKCIISRI